jgi:hypothetical protein
MKAKIMFYDTVVGHDKNVLDFKGSVEYDISKYLYVFLSWTNGESKKVKYLMLNNNQSIRFTNSFKYTDRKETNIAMHQQP